MRKKKLLTAALCAVLIMAAHTVSGGTVYKTLRVDTGSGNSSLVVYAQGEQDVPVQQAEAEELPVLKAETLPEANSETQPPATTEAPPAPVQTEAPPAPAQTEAPTTPAQTETPAPTPSEPATSAPSEPTTSAPTETPGTQEPSTEMPGTQPGTETLPSETQPGTETPATEGTQTETGGETTVTESETEETETETETEEETEKESETSKYKSNEELLAHQKIVVPPKIEKEFRFTKVDKRYAVVCSDKGTQVHEKKDENSRAVGELEYYGSCYILDDQSDGWYYIESGNVRGFIKADDVATDDVAERIFRVKGEEELPPARLLVARTENEAFEYTHTTVQDVVVAKKYALASGEVKIYEQRKTSSSVTGILSDQALCYILADSDKDWIFVESGDARGFVEKSKLITGSAANRKVSDKGEKNMALAQMQIAPENNKACYYTLTSVKEASQAAKTREAMVNFALQFVGCPYVWGGTSLTGGADCSGFVQSIYANFGYSLPRVAEAQSGYGMQIPVASAEPGDLIFYARNGYVYHVSMYIGNGQVVQAANKRAGIITSGIAGDAVWATRVITD